MKQKNKEEAHTDRQPHQHHKVQQAEQQREAHDYKHQINHRAGKIKPKKKLQKHVINQPSNQAGRHPD